MSRSSKIPNTAARGAYLEILQSVWPEVLRSLHHDVFLRLVRSWPSRLEQNTGLVTGPMHEFQTAMEGEAGDALELWARAFFIEDQWLLSSARMTLYMYGMIQRDATKEFPGWVQAPPRDMDQFGAFEFAVSQIWIPKDRGGISTWADFSKKIRDDLDKALKIYRKAQTAHWGVLRDNTERHARWTAMYQKGIAAIEIAKELPSPYEDPSQAVWKAISRFAEDIGLTLRQNRGRTSN